MKRLEIATVLAKSHKLCIFDEPEAGIDLWSFSMLIQEFEKIHDKKAESLILISHQERIIQMADRIMVIESNSSSAFALLIRSSIRASSAESVTPNLFSNTMLYILLKVFPVTDIIPK